MILNLSEISLSFGDNEILKNISFLINEGEKVALIGDNGCGKSTLLKIICKEYTPDNGTVVTKKDSTLGYVKQHQNFESTKTLYEVLYFSVFVFYFRFKRLIHSILLFVAVTGLFWVFQTCNYRVMNLSQKVASYITEEDIQMENGYVIKHPEKVEDVNIRLKIWL